MQPLRENDFRLLSQAMKDYPSLTLRVYWSTKKNLSVGFLRNLPALRDLDLQWHTKDLDAKQELKQLETWR